MAVNIDLKTLFQFIPNFKSEAEEAFTFIQNCQNAVDLATKDQQPILLAYIKSRISGNASIILMNKKIDNWNSLKEELNIIFREKHSNLQLHRELISLKQRQSESVLQFTQRCETLQRRMLQNAKGETKEEDWNGKSSYIKSNILSSFINGLNEKIGTYCNTLRPTNLSEATSYAVEEESRLYVVNNFENVRNPRRDYSNRNTVKINVTQIKCYTCGKMGHKSN